MEYGVNMESISSGCAIVATSVGCLLNYNCWSYKRFAGDPCSCCEVILEKIIFCYSERLENFCSALHIKSCKLHLTIEVSCLLCIS